MAIADLDAELNQACMEEFGEEVIFETGGRAVARFLLLGERDEFGVPIEQRVPGLELPFAELQRIGAKEGDRVIVRGKTYTLMNGVNDDVVDAGGMAHILLREYSQ